ncbi:hypothetical protein QYF36_013271 [Acer negundo]|nr:hypothetical protein QYF36_013271 [Acer negundo]
MLLCFCVILSHTVLFLLQNDYLIHAWGRDFQLSYCAQGERTKIVSVVDSEYIVHLGLPTLSVSTDEPEHLLHAVKFHWTSYILSEGAFTKLRSFGSISVPQIRI